MDTPMTPPKLTFVRNEYGGTVYHIEFHRPFTIEETNKIIRSAVDATFGWRTVAQGKTNITVKVHND